MRTRTAIVMTTVFLATAAPVRGGVYINDPTVPNFYVDRASPMLGKSLYLFRSQKHPELLAARMPNTQTRLSQRYLQRIAALKKKGADLSVEDRANLGGMYLGLFQREEDAVKVMEPAARGAGRNNFMLLANLAVAHQRAQRLDRAISYQELALQNWPKIYPGYTTEQLQFYRRVEEFYLRLLKLRYREQLKGQQVEEEGVDEIFPGVRFVGADGEYQAGAIDPKMYPKLPADALHIVEQLLLWAPEDNRLMWLFAELLNAYGQVLPAYQIIDKISFNSNYSPRQMARHRRVMQGTIEMYDRGRLGYWAPLMSWMLLPHTPNLAPGASILALGAGPAGRIDYLTQQTQLQNRPPGTNLEPEPVVKKAEETDKSWLPNWRDVTVSFLAGGVFAFLMTLQINEMRRRRRQREISDKEPQREEPTREEAEADESTSASNAEAG